MQAQLRSIDEHQNILTLRLYGDGDNIDLPMVIQISCKQTLLTIAGICLGSDKGKISQEYQQSFLTTVTLKEVFIRLKSFSEHHLLSLVVIAMHLWVALTTTFRIRYDVNQAHLFLSGIAIECILGLICLQWLASHEGRAGLNRFLGPPYKHPGMAFIFLLCCFGASVFSGSPIHPREELIFGHVHNNQTLFAFFISLCFIIDELAIMTLSARVSPELDVKSQYVISYWSS